ncbi:MAG: aldo/keto reductase [Candidatus Nealsonbacteria bacterium DGGOD1a]|jgi:Predicted oxidoreductases (related to aryl-alcohol dehydrogenases)|nr:MAG: aldo/keto reductase [Candidatus Nealsonbacteria bacterium DGGOD1a]
MEFVNLGKTNLKISRLGVGTWAIGGFGWGKINDFDSIAALRRAWDLGINFFDTADVYGRGHAEEILARALGENRKNAVIATKFGVRVGPDGKTFKDISPQYAVEALEASLRRLKIECVPLYQIHWPDGATSIGETMAALVKCQEQGKIMHIGYSNFPVGLIERAERVGRGESTQAPYNLIDRGIETELVPFCKERKITLITYGSLAQGLLSGKIAGDFKFGKDDVRGRYSNWQGEKFQQNLELAKRAGDIGKKYAKTAAQTAIRWVLDRNSNGAALVGITKPEHIVENIGALDWRLPQEDLEFLSKSVA